MKFKKKKNQQNSLKKSFFFDDDTDVDDLIKSKNDKIFVSYNRTAFIFFIFLSLTLIFCIKVTYLSFLKKNSFQSSSNYTKNFKIRGDIVDRDLNILARNVN